MEHLVRRFNDLPRPGTILSGQTNHWVFRTCFIPSQQPKAVLIAVHPQSSYQYARGPTQGLESPSISERANAIVEPLLEIFLNADEHHKHANHRGGRCNHKIPLLAPWTWATEGQEFASAVESKLRQHGIKDALCRVGVCTPQEIDVVNAIWLRNARLVLHFLGGELEWEELEVGLFFCQAKSEPSGSEASGGILQLGDDSQCHHCRKSLVGNRGICSACHKAYYCNKECQMADWKRHKDPDCLKNRPFVYGPTIPSFDYFTTMAWRDPEALALAEKVNLQLPPHPHDQYLAKPIRRLIMTGNDTPENMRLFFGPSWHDTQSQHNEARIVLLLDPPRGSHMDAINYKLDIGWTGG